MVMCKHEWKQLLGRNGKPVIQHKRLEYRHGFMLFCSKCGELKESEAFI